MRRVCFTEAIAHALACVEAGIASIQVTKDMRLSSFRSRAAAQCLLYTLTIATLAGCHTHKGIGTIGNDGRGVDPSWTRAARSCWPDLGKEGYSTDDISRNLASPTRFRNAFPVYAAQGDDALNTGLATPVQSAPPPDVSKLTHSTTPVFNRGQAVNGTDPRDAVVQSTNGTAPPDALCSIQTGIPQGFSK